MCNAAACARRLWVDPTATLEQAVGAAAAAEAPVAGALVADIG